MIINNHRNQKVLVVDDVPMNIELLESMLIPAGYIIEKAKSGEEALEKIRVSIPDLVLLDVMMPQISGYDVCRRIREDKSLPYIPIIFITASELNQKDIIFGLDQGGDDYIRKPFNVEELLSRIRSCLRLKTLYDDLARTKLELARYVSLSTLRMVEKIASGEASELNKTAEVTVLFSDIRGFTNISESMNPADVFKMLNLNLGKQIEIIEEYKGVIDKLNGDEIMAVFEGQDRAENALQCALKVIDALTTAKPSRGVDWSSVGIGINTGPVFWGSLGSISFQDFTVVGNTVNIAARLCGLADRFQVLFTESTLKLIRPERYNYKSIGRKMLKGLSAPVEIFAMSLNADRHEKSSTINSV
jgi:class 3 adenylate cyclase